MWSGTGGGSSQQGREQVAAGQRWQTSGVRAFRREGGTTAIEQATGVETGRGRSKDRRQERRQGVPARGQNECDRARTRRHDRAANAAKTGVKSGVRAASGRSGVRAEQRRPDEVAGIASGRGDAE